MFHYMDVLWLCTLIIMIVKRLLEGTLFMCALVVSLVVSLHRDKEKTIGTQC